MIPTNDDFLTLPTLSTYEKRLVWCRRYGVSTKVMASIVGTSQNKMSAQLLQDTLAEDVHQKLTAAGIPAEILPPSRGSRRRGLSPTAQQLLKNAEAQA